jgi:peptidyl-prolyl cis-trans isomerase C
MRRHDALFARCLREPLFHFMLAGCVLFAGYRALNPAPAESASAHQIRITEDDVRQMAMGWVAQGRTTPTPQQLESLVDARVREEIFFREAQALGLDRNDTIVRRRLAQKMEFLAEDLAGSADPTRDELRAWYVAHGERFASPARTSFRHLYFSPDRRGARAQDDAAASLAKLRAKPPGAHVAEGMADPFMYQDYYADRSHDEVSRVFGVAFAQALFAQKPGAWLGPIQSGYGWHLVWVDRLAPQQVPAFEEVEPEARRAWVAERRAARKREVFESIRARYEVILPPLRAARASGAESRP